MENLMMKFDRATKLNGPINDHVRVDCVVSC